MSERTATIEQLYEALAQREQKPNYSTFYLDYGWGRQDPYTYHPNNFWVLPTLLFNALEDFTTDVGNIFRRYKTVADAVTALDAARTKLYEQLGRASGKKPFYGSASFTYIWDDGGHPEKFTRDVTSQVPKEVFENLSGNVYGNWCRNYPSESKAYAALGRAMVDTRASQIDKPKQPNPEPETKVEATTTKAVKTYAPAASPSAVGAYWHKNSSMYGDASLPPDLFDALTGAVSKSPDWAYYASADLAKAALHEARKTVDAAELAKLEPVTLKGHDKLAKACGPYVQYDDAYGWTRHYSDRYTRYYLPPELHAALEGGTLPLNNDGSVLLLYPTELEAAKALRAVLAKLKWEKGADGKWGPPAPPKPASFADTARTYEPHVSQTQMYIWTTAERVGAWFFKKNTSCLPDDVWAALEGNSDGVRATGAAALAAHDRWKSYKTRDEALKALHKALGVAGPRVPARISSSDKYLWLTAGSLDTGFGNDPVNRALCTVPDDVYARLVRDRNADSVDRYYEPNGWILYHDAEKATKAYENAVASLAEDKRKAAVDTGDDRAPAMHDDHGGSWYWTTVGYSWILAPLTNRDRCQVTKEIFDKITSTHGSGTHTRQFKTEAEAVAAYKDAKAAYELEKAALAAEAAKKAAEVVKSEEPKTEPAYKPYKSLVRADGWVWISAKKPGSWAGDVTLAKLPSELFGRLTGASKCYTSCDCCWAGYDSEKEALAGLADARALVALDAKLASTEVEPAYEPLEYVSHYTNARVFWVAQNHVARGWGKDTTRATLPEDLFAALPDNPTEKTRERDNYNNGYATREQAMTALEEAKKTLAAKKGADVMVATSARAKPAMPAVGSQWGEVVGLRSSVPEDTYEVLRTDEKTGEVTVKFVKTQTIVMTAEMFRARFVESDKWEQEPDCDADGELI